jgi:hypothetical protein
MLIRLLACNTAMAPLRELLHPYYTGTSHALSPTFTGTGTIDTETGTNPRKRRAGSQLAAVSPTPLSNQGTTSYSRATLVPNSLGSKRTLAQHEASNGDQDDKSNLGAADVRAVELKDFRKYQLIINITLILLSVSPLNTLYRDRRT